MLQTLLTLMKNDPYVAVKVLKMKILSNMVRHFVLDCDPEDQLTVQSSECLITMLQVVAENEHWPTLLHKSE